MGAATGNMQTNEARDWRSAFSTVFSIEFLVFVVGKVCLFIALYFAGSMGFACNKIQAFEIPTLNVSGGMDETQIKRKVSLVDYSVIVKRDLFASSDKTTRTTQAPPVKTKLNLRLVGTNLSAMHSPFAIIEDKSKRQQDVFEVNESIFGKAKLTEIFPEYVRLEHAGKIEALYLEDGSSSPGPSSTDGPPSDDQSSFSIPEEELSEALANLPKLLVQARAVPYFRNGESIGMRLFAIKRGSLYEKLGLKNGDIIRSINDTSLSDPAQALKLFEELKDQRAIEVTLERAGQEKNLQYSID